MRTRLGRTPIRLAPLTLLAVSCGEPARDATRSTASALTAADVSAEFALDTAVPTTTLARVNTYTAVGCNDLQCVAVYVAPRGGLLYPIATRVGIDGTPLDPQGIVMPTPGTSEVQGGGMSVAVASNNRDFLVAWAGEPSGSGVDGFNAIYAARVREDGSLADTAPIRISAASAESEYGAAVSFDGQNYVVVWAGYRPGVSTVYAARVDENGTVLDPGGVPLTQGLSSNYASVGAATVASSVPYGVSLVGYEYTRFAPYDDHPWVSGNVLFFRQDGTTFRPSQSLPDAYAVASGPTIAWGAGSFLVTWAADDCFAVYGNCQFPLMAARFNPAGVLYDGHARTLMPAFSAAGARGAVFDGSGTFMLGWTGPTVARIDAFNPALLDTPSGIALTPNATLVGGFQPTAAVSFSATTFRAAWQAGGAAYGARISRGGAVLDAPAVPMLTSANRQTGPAVATDGTQYLAVWADERSGAAATMVYARRFDALGQGVGEPFAVAPGANVAQYAPAVAYNGLAFVVAWEEAPSSWRRVRAARVGVDGTVLDAAPLEVDATSAQSPAVASDGERALLAWTRNTYDSDGQVFVRTIDRDGAMSDPQGVTPAGVYGTHQHAPAVSPAGAAGYLVVWEDSDTSRAVDLRAARVNADGTVPTATPTMIATSVGSGAAPAVAFDGTQHLIAWRANGNVYPGPGGDILGARLGVDGTVLDPVGFPIATAPRDQRVPTVAFDGQRFRVTWQDRRNAGSTGFDVYATSVGRDGHVSEPEGVPVAAGPRGEWQPRIASRGGGEAMVVYARFDDAPSVMTDRVFGRMLHAGNGDACADASECPSGFCVDGVCCDSACGGGDPGDCVACSARAGAARSGACSAARAGTVCRASAGPCDAVESCDGVASGCPADAPAMCPVDAGEADAAGDAQDAGADAAGDADGTDADDAGVVIVGGDSDATDAGSDAGTGEDVVADDVFTDDVLADDVFTDDVLADNVPVTDGGELDANVDDASASESGTDAGVAVDAGTGDAAANDATVHDVAAIDADDATVRDVVAIDANDANDANDASSTDSGSVGADARPDVALGDDVPAADATRDSSNDAAAEAGADATPEQPHFIAGGGCGCSTAGHAPTSSAPALLALLAAAVVAARRRTRA